MHDFMKLKKEKRQRYWHNRKLKQENLVQVDKLELEHLRDCYEKYKEADNSKLKNDINKLKNQNNIQKAEIHSKNTEINMLKEQLKDTNSCLKRVKEKYSDACATELNLKRDIQMKDQEILRLQTNDTSRQQ